MLIFTLVGEIQIFELYDVSFVVVQAWFLHSACEVLKFASFVSCDDIKIRKRMALKERKDAVGGEKEGPSSDRCDTHDEWLVVKGSKLLISELAAPYKKWGSLLNKLGLWPERNVLDFKTRLDRFPINVQPEDDVREIIERFRIWPIVPPEVSV